MGSWARAGLLALVLSALQGPPRAVLLAEEPGALLGRFKPTYYYVAEEREGGPWPLYGHDCRSVLARTSREFHLELSREGTGRLRDGRILNFAQRCACARAGHQGSRVCYEVLDEGAFPWGRGGQMDGRALPLRPFLSVAVDPKVIPLGTVLFVREWAGRTAPDGTRLSGCVRAEDAGRMVRGRHLDLFAGKARWAQVLQQGFPSERVTVYRGGRRCRDRPLP